MRYKQPYACLSHCNLQEARSYVSRTQNNRFHLVQRIRGAGRRARQERCDCLYREYLGSYYCKIGCR